MGNRLHMGGGPQLPFTVPVHRAGHRHVLIPAQIGAVGTCSSGGGRRKLPASWPAWHSVPWWGTTGSCTGCPAPTVALYLGQSARAVCWDEK